MVAAGQFGAAAPRREAAAAVVTGGFAEAGLEHPAEVAEVVETPSGRQGADRPVQLGTVPQILTAVSQPPLPQVPGGGRSFGFEKLVELADRDVVGRRDQLGRQIRFAQMRLDEILDPEDEALPVVVHHRRGVRPALGADEEYVYGELLGLGSAERAALEDAEVIY